MAWQETGQGSPGLLLCPGLYQHLPCSLYLLRQLLAQVFELHSKQSNLVQSRPFRIHFLTNLRSFSFVLVRSRSSSFVLVYSNHLLPVERTRVFLYLTIVNGQRAHLTRKPPATLASFSPCSKRHLAPFLPSHPISLPLVGTGGATGGQSFGTVSGSSNGSSSILPITWCYLRLMGSRGLALASQLAILNANYMARRLEPFYSIVFRNQNGQLEKTRRRRRRFGQFFGR